MKKIVLVLLAGMLLFSSASANEAYGRYRVTAGDATFVGGWIFYPLDAHNVLVNARSYENKPWHLTWYRDGEKFRDLAWIVEEPYLEGGMIPEPVLWDGEHLTVIYGRRKGDFREIIRNGVHTADPDNYETLLAEWTDGGLENGEEPPESWYGTQDLGGLMIRHENGAFRVLQGGEEIPLPESFRTLPKDQVVNLAFYPYGEQSCLLAWLDYQEAFADRHFHVIASDHGKVVYDVVLADEDSWEIIPDGKGGFMHRNGWPEGNYEPVRLTHYSAEGEPDRKLQLEGPDLVKGIEQAVSCGDGSTVLYGTAVANSKKIYSVFRMTLDGDLNMTDLDVRDLDPRYGAYSPGIRVAPDGTAWVLIYEPEPKNGLRPVLIPFGLLDRSADDRGLALR